MRIAHKAALALSAIAMAVPLASPATAAESFPGVIALPDGWGAEGIATGPGSIAYAGSLASGAIYRADLRTGAGSVLVPPQGRPSVGLKHSHGQLFVAAGPTGLATVYDASDGSTVQTLQLGSPGVSFINDVIVTRDAAWFTDSFQPFLYRVPWRNGTQAGPVETVPLSGDWMQVPGFNANGIAATENGKELVVINSSVGKVYRVDPATGAASEIVADRTLTAGDGILLRGSELSVVRNRLNEVVVLKLAGDLASATTTAVLTDPDFAVPTTLARFGSDLYAVNARFGLAPGPFTIVKVDGA